MKLNIKKTIADNIVSAEITVAELGTATSVSEDEKALLQDFPRSVIYSDITFKANMKKDANGDAVVTEDPVDGTTIVEVQMDVINKEYPIDENMDIKISIDATKIPETDITSVFDSKEAVAKAKITMAATKIQAEIAKKLAEIRTLNTKFEGDTEVIM